MQNNSTYKGVLKEGRTRFGSNLCPQTRSFGVGVAYSLIERVKELMQADVDNTPGTGLVLVSLYQTELTENENFIKASGTQLKTDNRGSKHVHVSAFKARVIHGNNIPLNNQVGANKKPELLN